MKQMNWGVFDAIYLINLRERTDRRRELEAELRSVCLLPDDPRLVWLNAVRPETRGEFPSIGAYGCFLSHLACLQSAADRGHERILIIEDDAYFPKTAMDHLREALLELSRSEWQIWYGGHVFVGKDTPSTPGWGVPVDRRIGVQTTHCVGFHGWTTINSVRAFLELILSRPAGHIEAGPMHVDGAYSTWRYLSTDAITRAAIPAICHQRSSRSDVAVTGLLDTYPIIRSIIHPLRRLRNYMRKTR